MTKYRISNNFGNNQFSIDSNSGVLKVIKKLDRETKDKMTLEITAYNTNNQARKSSVNIVITVSDVNDNAPIFQGLNQYSVAENVRRNTQVFTAKATDRDIGKM